jgi:hypothetical protein
MTQKLYRWNCPKCDARNVVPAAEAKDPEALRCDSCHYVNDPLDDTWPRPEGWTGDEENAAPKLRMTRRPGSRQTPV